MRERVLRLCLYAYPVSSRMRDGQAIIDLASELAAESGWAFAREVVGMIRGGLGARAKLVWLDFTGAPWRAALESLALPLAVAMLCLYFGEVMCTFPGFGHWMGVWALLGVLGGAASVWGAASRRRPLTVMGSLLLLGLMIFEAFSSLAPVDGVRWSASFLNGQLNVLAMWLPVPVLLMISSWTVGRTGFHRRPLTARWMIIVPVALSVLVPLALKLQDTEMWAWPSRAGNVFIWVPFALVLVAVVLGIARRDPVAKTAAAILVVGAVLPFMWVLALVLPAPYGPEQYILLTYWLPGLVAAVAVMLLLLRRRVARSAEKA